MFHKVEKHVRGDGSLPPLAKPSAIHMGTNGDSKTLNVYASMASEYAAMAKEYENDPSLSDFIARMKKGGHVLDLGCGPGWAAARMAAAGLLVDAVDAVPEMVEMAARFPGVRGRLGTFEDVSGCGLYEGIWANFSLLHASRPKLPHYLAKLREALKPAGLLHMGMKTGSGSKRDRLGRLYTYVAVNELNEMLMQAGFSHECTRTGSGKGLDGTTAPWVTILSRR